MKNLQLYTFKITQNNKSNEIYCKNLNRNVELVVG